MQRAAASAAVKEAQSGSDENPPTPKRPRLSNEAASPGAPQSELDAINAALAAEEEKRREAIARQAAEAGETEWVLDIPPAVQYPQQPVVLAADSLDAEDDVLQGGRQSFGKFKRKTKYVSFYIVANGLSVLTRFRPRNYHRQEMAETARRIQTWTRHIPSRWKDKRPRPSLLDCPN